MFFEQTEKKQQDDFCNGCPHGRFNQDRGLFGAYDCYHPDNTHSEHWPKLVIDIFDKVIKCEFTDRHQPVKENMK